MTDLRYALRMLMKSPSFTLLAVLTLALGIGVNTAIFSLIHDLFLRGLPFSQPDRIVRIYGEAKERNMQQLPFSVPRFWHFRDGQSVFSGMAADSGMGFILTGPDLLGAGGGHWHLSRPPMPLETSLPGVFAAGDVREGSIKRVASAVVRRPLPVVAQHCVRLGGFFEALFGLRILSRIQAP